MTESEWMSSTDPAAMLRPFGIPPRHVSESAKISDRKLRLWVEACRASGEAHDYVDDLYSNSGLSVAIAYWTHRDGERQVSMVVRANLLREIIGTPHTRKRFLWEYDYSGDDQWKQWTNPTVLSIAQAAYDSIQIDGPLEEGRLLVLSDALEEAGCNDPYLLGHLRGEEYCHWCLEGSHGNEQACGGRRYGKYPRGWHGWLRSDTKHYKGCWVIDLLLGKE